jgi:hypothetical protein
MSDRGDLRKAAEILLVLIATTGCATPKHRVSVWRGPVPSYENEAVRYFPPAKELLAQVKIEHITLSAAENDRLEKLAQAESPQGLRRFVLDPADMLKPGPWETRIYIYNRDDSGKALKLKFSDHGNGGVRVSWLNEKLVFIQVWWGRIRSTDIVFDCERGKPLYMEDADYFKLTYHREP